MSETAAQWQPWIERWGAEPPYSYPLVECRRVSRWQTDRPDDHAAAHFTIDPRSIGELFDVGGLWWRPAKGTPSEPVPENAANTHNTPSHAADESRQK